MRATAVFRRVTPCSLFTLRHIPKSFNNSNYRSKDLTLLMQYKGECDTLIGCGLQTHL